jgi:hypothetical protein
MPEGIIFTYWGWETTTLGISGDSKTACLTAFSFNDGAVEGIADAMGEVFGASSLTTDGCGVLPVNIDFNFLRNVNEFIFILF